MPQCDVRTLRHGAVVWRCDKPAVPDRSFCEQHLAEAMARVRAGAKARPSTTRIPFVRKTAGGVW